MTTTREAKILPGISSACSSLSVWTLISCNRDARGRVNVSVSRWIWGEGSVGLNGGCSYASSAAAAAGGGRAMEARRLDWKGKELVRRRRPVLHSSRATNNEERRQLRLRLRLACQARGLPSRGSSESAASFGTNSSSLPPASVTLEPRKRERERSARTRYSNSLACSRRRRRQHVSQETLLLRLYTHVFLRNGMTCVLPHVCWNNRRKEGTRATETKSL